MHQEDLETIMITEEKYIKVSKEEKYLHISCHDHLSFQPLGYSRYFISNANY